MNETIDATAWVYVIIQNPGRNESIMGQHDAEREIVFLPFFKDRDTALQGFMHLAKEPGGTFEVQAIIFEDLTGHAVKSGFLLFQVDGNGRIVSKLAPDGRPL